MDVKERVGGPLWTFAMEMSIGAWKPDEIREKALRAIEQARRESASTSFHQQAVGAGDGYTFVVAPSPVFVRPD